jgi:hypothetical protein
LQADRAKLKGKEMRERLQKLNDKEGSFGHLLKKIKKTSPQETDSTATDSDSGREDHTTEAHKNNSVKVNLTEEERAKVEHALTSIDTLKTNAKRQMARAKIVDLSKI